MDDLNEFRVFRAIAEGGSLVRAAGQLGIPRSTVSKRLADLETRLGQELFKRTTRRVALTAAGRTLYEKVARGLDIIHEGATALREGAARRTRRIVISAPPLLAAHVVGTVAGQLLRRDGPVRIEVLSRIDFDAERDAEVDVRISAHPGGRAPAGAHIAGHSSRGIYAAPALVAALPSPLTLDDLPPDRLVMRSPWKTLTLTRGRRRATLACDGPLVVEHDEAVRDAVIGGALFGILPRFIARPCVEQGRLVQVLEDWKFPDVPIAITLAPHARHCPVAGEIVALLPAALQGSGLFR